MKRFLPVIGNVVLAVYFWITICALLLTVFRIRILYPRDAVLYAYGMMAPYQSYGLFHEELLAEGQTADGQWHAIDLYSYYPVLFGEANVRQYFAMHNYSVDDPENIRIRKEYAKRLLTLEEQRGHAYQAVRLTWQEWPNMAGDFYQNKLPYVTDSTLLLEMKHE